MRTLFVEAEAETEVAAAIDWYEQHEAGLGAALLIEFEQIVAGLHTGRVRGVGVPGLRRDLRVRRAILSRFPYAVVYLENEQTLHVLAFAHQKRRPGYWTARIPAR